MSASSGEKRMRVLAVGMFDSPHFAKWLSLHSHRPINFLLFPSSPHRRLNSELSRLLSSDTVAKFELSKLSGFAAPIVWLINKCTGGFAQKLRLQRLILAFRPDFVHALELQGAGYMSARALQSPSLRNTKFIVTNYGSDIYWFQSQPRHRRQLVHLLERADQYAAECNRDVELARSLGFKGEVMPVMPNAGGFPARKLKSCPVEPSLRNLIMVKGYHGWVGRAHIALQALESISAELQDYEIVVYSCNLSTKRLATQVAKRTGLTITAYSKGALTHDVMVEKFSRSLIYSGLSLSDGISTSMLEAMAMGAIPVQTSTACCDEWFSETGVAIETLAAEEVAQGIQRAIGLALTTDSAAKNRETIRARASREEIAKQALAFYQL